MMRARRCFITSRCFTIRSGVIPIMEGCHQPSLKGSILGTKKVSRNIRPYHFQLQGQPGLHRLTITTCTDTDFEGRCKLLELLKTCINEFCTIFGFECNTATESRQQYTHCGFDIVSRVTLKNIAKFICEYH